jgi:OCT family organic cation transporter-like MFS transporter 4/5
MVGDQNKWQIVIFLYTWIEGFLIGFHHLSSSFLGASDGHWCNFDLNSAINNTGWTLEQKKSYALPVNAETNKIESCKMFDLSGISIPSDFDAALSARGDLGIIDCPDKHYSYDTSNGIDSIVYQWNLVCDDLWKLSTIQGSYMGGVFVGCMVWGWASDKFGRRLTMLVAAVIQVASSILAAFAPNYIIFIMLRFLIAFSVSGVFECGFVLVTEICGPHYRTYFGILTQFPFGWGAALLPVIAYFIRAWKSLQLAISIPCVLLGIFYWTIPESPRWLVAEGRLDEALAILKNGAKTNNKQLPPDDELMEMLTAIAADDEDAQKEEKVEVELSASQKFLSVFEEIFVLVKTPEMRKRTLNIFFSWLIVAMVYYGLSLNSKNLGGDRYVNGFLSGFVEVPAVVVIIPLLAKLGRVKCYSGTFIAGGICCCLVALVTSVTSGQGWAIALSVAIGIVGKFLISMTFAIAYLYTAELFPTKVRNLAVGLASTFARIGSISAPYIVDLLGSIHAGIPVVIFGLCSFAAGVTSLMLPETLNKRMPESVADVERAGRRKKGQESEEMNAVAPPAEEAGGE